jgi:hypothetical protein
LWSRSCSTGVTGVASSAHILQRTSVKSLTCAYRSNSLFPSVSISALFRGGQEAYLCDERMPAEI